MKFYKNYLTFANCCGSLCMGKPNYVFTQPNMGVRLEFQPLKKLKWMRYDEVKTSEGTIYLEYPDSLDLVSEINVIDTPFYYDLYTKHPYFSGEVELIQYKEHLPEQDEVDQLNREYWNYLTKKLKIPSTHIERKKELTRFFNEPWHPTIEHFSMSDIHFSPNQYKDKVGVCIFADWQEDEYDSDERYSIESIKEALGKRIIYQSQKFLNLNYPSNTNPYLTLFVFDKE